MVHGSPNANRVGLGVEMISAQRIEDDDEDRPWHALPIDQVLTVLGSGKQGLTQSEAAARLERFGPNALPHGKPPGIARVFLRQFLSPLIYVLLAAAAVSLVLGDWTDSAFILAVLVVNALIGTIQEYGAEQSAEALRAMVVARARAIRDGDDVELDAAELVPGDLVLLETGAKVPADVRLLSGAALEADESLLTGESLAVLKQPDRLLAATATLGDRANVAFAGTLVTRGRASGVVVATGLHTQLGRIARSTVGAASARPPLLIRMDRFTKRIALLVGAAVVMLAGISAARGSTLREVFFMAVALAVSAIPEGLPVALTVALGLGARRMSRRKVIARRLVAVEALGSCTFIASDKTGTLTLNQQTVGRIAFAGQDPWTVTASSATDGEVILPSPVDAVAGRALIERLAMAVALCNEGFLGRRGDRWVSHGDAVDVALLELAHQERRHARRRRKQLSARSVDSIRGRSPVRGQSQPVRRRNRGLRQGRERARASDVRPHGRGRRRRGHRCGRLGATGESSCNRRLPRPCRRRRARADRARRRHSVPRTSPVSCFSGSSA